MKLRLLCLAALLLAAASSCNDATNGDRTLNGTVSEISQKSRPVSAMDSQLKMEEAMRHSESSPDDNSDIIENEFLSALEEPLSTFSIDVDDAAYSNIRSYIKNGGMPPREAVRVEEMINYFNYEYSKPKDQDAFSINTELSVCPWDETHQLLHIGLQGKEIDTDKLPPSNFVFLVDVSGSMDAANKLPLVQSSLKMLTDRLRSSDRVALVAYAGEAGLVLPSTTGNEKNKIKDAINNLAAGGSTAGGAGIDLAYAEAIKHFVEGGNNRVILATDGDFNVGVSSEKELVSLIEKKRATGIFLSVLGFGIGDYQDGKMQELADRGNGNHSYIDNIREAQKVLIEEFGSTLFTIATDVKIQIEFNPARVAGYRLIGYENRKLANRDFNDDTKDAGEIGSGHTVTALYEIIPAGTKMTTHAGVDALKYQVVKTEPVTASNDLMTLKLRYKKPREGTSILLEHHVAPKVLSLTSSSDNFRFSASVAAFGMLLAESKYKGKVTYPLIVEMAKSARANDPEGYRAEFIQLVESTREVAKQ